MSVSILVVDDEPDVAELFRQRFRREARQGTYVMHFAASGEDALAKLDNGIRPELIVILSDINMPGMDGLALLREIKERWAELPVMMVTAGGSTAVTPFREESNALLTEIRRGVRRHRSRSPATDQPAPHRLRVRKKASLNASTAGRFGCASQYA